MANHNLDWAQVLREIYDKNSIGIATKANAVQVKTGVLSDVTGSDTVVAEFDVSNYKEFSLYVKSLSVIAVAKNIVVETSPAESGDLWFAIAGLTIATPVTAIVATPSYSILGAKRVRVKASGLLGTNESAQAWLVYR